MTETQAAKRRLSTRDGCLEHSRFVLWACLVFRDSGFGFFLGAPLLLSVPGTTPVSCPCVPGVRVENAVAPVDAFVDWRA